MHRLTNLEEEIFYRWEAESDNYDDPIDLIMDTIGTHIFDMAECCEFMTSLVVNGFIPNDLSYAIENGYDDVSGFTFFYLFMYFTKVNDIIDKLMKMKTMKSGV